MNQGENLLFARKGPRGTGQNPNPRGTSKAMQSVQDAFLSVEVRKDTAPPLSGKMVQIRNGSQICPLPLSPRFSEKRTERDGRGILPLGTVETGLLDALKAIPDSSHRQIITF
jgi:hypothetical protein